MVVLNPLHTIFKNYQYTFGYIVASHILSFSLIVVVTLYLKFKEQLSPTNFCLPFIDPNNSISTIKVLVWTVICSQCITSLIITAAHTMLIRILYRNQEKLERNFSSYSAYCYDIFQFFLLVSS